MLIVVRSLPQLLQTHLAASRCRTSSRCADLQAPADLHVRRHSLCKGHRQFEQASSDDDALNREVIERTGRVLDSGLQGCLLLVFATTVSLIATILRFMLFPRGWVERASLRPYHQGRSRPTADDPAERLTRSVGFTGWDVSRLIPFAPRGGLQVDWARHARLLCI